MATYSSILAWELTARRDWRATVHGVTRVGYTQQLNNNGGGHYVAGTTLYPDICVYSVPKLGPTLCDPADRGVLCPRDFPGKNTRVGCHFLLQRNFPTQETNPSLWHLLQWQADSLPLSHLGNPYILI